MRPPELLRIGRRHRAACSTCGTTTSTYLVTDGDQRYCNEHDPLVHLRARMRDYRGDPFSPEWAVLVDEEQDIMRRRGLDIFGRPGRWSDRVRAARGEA